MWNKGKRNSGVIPACVGLFIIITDIVWTLLNSKWLHEGETCSKLFLRSCDKRDFCFATEHLTQDKKCYLESDLQCVHAKCEGDDEQQSAGRTRRALWSALTRAEWYHSSLLEAIYSQDRCCLCFALSVSVCVLYSCSEVIGSLVAVCLCVGSLSRLKCFIEPVCLLFSLLQLPFTEDSAQ